MKRSSVKRKINNKMFGFLVWLLTDELLLSPLRA
jgi:hypothetical protein